MRSAERAISSSAASHWASSFSARLRDSPRAHSDTYEIVRVGAAIPLFGNGSATLHTIPPLLTETLRRLFRRRRFDVVVALGAVIRGETDHYEHIAHAAASGLAAVARESGIPVGFGVLTVGEESQARR